MAVTMRDVAKHAGVAPRTVSNVVNDYPYVSDKMRAKVQAALEELNYRPNLMARGLRRGRTGIITLLLPLLTAPYFGEIAHEVVERASALGCTVMIDETGGDPQRELALLDIADRAGWVDGALMSPQGINQRALNNIRTNIPIVLLGERTAKSTLDHVGIDNVAAARDAVRHLIASGCQRVAAIGGSSVQTDVTSRQRLKGYRAALRTAGRETDDGLYVRTAEYGRSNAAAAVRQLMQASLPPDGLFCFSDELAVGAIRELHVHGIRVPDDVKVVGFDDIDETRYSVPTISSIRPDKAHTALAALTMLLDRVDGSSVPPRDVTIGYELVVRESSSGPAGAAGAEK
jgi:LacI family repressor for deo operon, udp, cdd, tsx, nupC, and nupG